MLIALLAVPGVDLIAIVIVLGVVLSRKRWVYPMILEQFRAIQRVWVSHSWCVVDGDGVVPIVASGACRRVPGPGRSGAVG
jgi:hypothetical protein